MADALHSPKGMRRHSNRPSSHAKAVFLQSRFFSGICQKAHAKSMLVKIFAIPILERLSSILGNGNVSFTVTSFSGRKSQQKRSSPVFFFYHDYATGPRRIGGLYQSKGQQILHFLIGFRCLIRGHSPCSFSVWYSLRL